MPRPRASRLPPERRAAELRPRRPGARGSSAWNGSVFSQEAFALELLPKCFRNGMTEPCAIVFDFFDRAGARHYRGYAPMRERELECCGGKRNRMIAAHRFYAPHPVDDPPVRRLVVVVRAVV